MFGGISQTVPWLSWSIIAAEILLGIWLIIAWRHIIAAFVALLLLAIFSGAILHDMAQHYPQPCGCFGAAWKQAHEPAAIERGLALGLGRNIVLIAFAAAFMFLDPPSRSRLDSDHVSVDSGLSQTVKEREVK